LAEGSWGPGPIAWQGLYRNLEEKTVKSANGVVYYAQPLATFSDFMLDALFAYPITPNARSAGMPVRPGIRGGLINPSRLDPTWADAPMTGFGVQAREVFRGREVIDLGAGDPTLSIVPRTIAERFGATGYVAVDANYEKNDQDGTTRFVAKDIVRFLKELTQESTGADSPGRVFVVNGLENKSGALATPDLELIGALSRVIGPNDYVYVGSASPGFDLLTSMGLVQITRSRVVIERTLRAAPAIVAPLFRHTIYGKKPLADEISAIDPEAPFYGSAAERIAFERKLADPSFAAWGPRWDAIQERVSKGTVLDDEGLTLRLLRGPNVEARRLILAHLLVRPRPRYEREVERALTNPENLGSQAVLDALKKWDRPLRKASHALAVVAHTNNDTEVRGRALKLFSRPELRSNRTAHMLRDLAGHNSFAVSWSASNALRERIAQSDPGALEVTLEGVRNRSLPAEQRRHLVTYVFKALIQADPGGQMWASELVQALDGEGEVRTRLKIAEALSASFAIPERVEPAILAAITDGDGKLITRVTVQEGDQKWRNFVYEVLELSVIRLLRSRDEAVRERAFAVYTDANLDVNRMLGQLRVALRDDAALPELAPIVARFAPFVTREIKSEMERKKYQDDTPGTQRLLDLLTAAGR
jgi:hypothetical protein